VRAFVVDSHRPRFVADEATALAGSVIGLFIEDRRTGGKLLYAPCLGSLNEPLLALAREADAILIEGTFWSDDEPLRFGTRTALQMGHVPVSGPQGSLAWLSNLPVRHRVYVHVNNTNPMLNETGSEYRVVTECGVRVGADGEEFQV
jgi:pyrroloquinoline quinone biosynthesis protein B